MRWGSAGAWFTLLGVLVDWVCTTVGGLPADADPSCSLREPLASAFEGAPGPSRDCRDCRAVLLQRVAHELGEVLNPLDGLLVAGVLLVPVRPLHVGSDRLH